MFLQEFWIFCRISGKNKNPVLSWKSLFQKFSIYWLGKINFIWIRAKSDNLITNCWQSCFSISSKSLPTYLYRWSLYGSIGIEYVIRGEIPKECSNLRGSVHFRSEIIVNLKKTISTGQAQERLKVWEACIKITYFNLISYFSLHIQYLEFLWLLSLLM